METQYRIPTLDEFVQGFKFQRLENKKGDRIGALRFLDAEYDAKYGKIFYAEKDEWYDFEVWWDKKPEWTTVKYGECNVTYKPIPEFDWLPWTSEGYIQKLIEDGKVRCECK